MKSIPYGKQEITDDDIKAVIETLQSEFLTQGPKIAEFERAFSAYVESPYAAAVSNGTTALHLCARALDVKKGDKYLTTPITFAASANCILYCGGEVIFTDIDPNTFLLDLNQIEDILRKDKAVRGIIPVDFAGAAVNLEELSIIAKKYNCRIIEDACHSPGGYFLDSGASRQMCGNGRFSDLSVFSFHPVKHIATGEGGIVTTSDKKLYERICLLRTHGITRESGLMSENHGGWYYQMTELGYNYRLSDLQAALGISQLKKAGERLIRRGEIANKYAESLRHLSDHVQLPGISEGHAFHLFVIRVLNEKRLGLYNYLRSKNIFCQVHYIPLHTMPYYQRLGFRKGDYPKAEKFYEECLSLPMYPSLKDQEQDYVIQTISDFYK